MEIYDEAKKIEYTAKGDLCTITELFADGLKAILKKIRETYKTTKVNSFVKSNFMPRTASYKQRNQKSDM